MRATDNKTDGKRRDRIDVFVPKGSHDKIKSFADGKCMTMQRFIREAINTYAGQILIPRA